MLCALRRRINGSSHPFKYPLHYLFYNPNIHPKKEYELRKQENIRFAEKHNVPFIDVDYDVDNWFERTKGLEFEPERGKRCTTCFDMRLAALLCMQKNMDFLSSHQV